jgi:hypothetical protein
MSQQQQQRWQQQRWQQQRHSVTSCYIYAADDVSINPDECVVEQQQ